MKFYIILITLALTIFGGQVLAQKKAKEEVKEKYFITSADVSTLKFRSIGPAMISGRISDIAVNPANNSEYFVAVASGKVFKTADGGITFSPVFDSQKPYSIGCVTYSKSNTNVIWVGSGENNSQRSVARGDGVYKSLDGGKSWENMGLKNSEHIGKIVVDADDENVVFVAAQGPLWNPGGDRGLYKTMDGGKTWEKILNISDNTGVSDLVIDSKNKNIMYAVAYQRRRHVYTLINGGPESAIYKTTDGGKTWRKLTKGLPSVELGRIGLAISESNPNYIYAIVEAQNDAGGFFRSTDKGESWEKMNSYVSSSPQYYQEIFVNPHNPDMVYSADTYSRYSTDGGKSWTNFSTWARHVDDHVIWIDKSNTNHILIGGDGGVYESFNNGKTFDYKQNLPLSQFYRVSTDNASPFFNIYGGTQDNNSVGGPSRTTGVQGIVNSDWVITHGGDGFETVIDPVDPNTVYSQSQYGWLVRYNVKTGEEIDIKPSEPDNGESYRWNWNSPLVLSSHNNATLYFAANKLFKSTDKGNSWEVISPDLTRQIDRNKLKVMGKIQNVDAVAKNASTSLFGNIVSLAESPVKSGVIYTGSDDGKFAFSLDDGKNWNSTINFPGVPDTTYISCIIASNFDEKIVYASFDNHKRGDYKPYILVSNDNGKSWKSISGNLPEDETVYSIVQDHMNPKLIFAGTEYGVYFTINEGENWVKLSSGMPSIAAYDIDIQKRENSLVIASFGRGFYIIDDYSMLRNIEKIKENKAMIFPIKPAYLFNQSSKWGGKKGHFGDDFYNGENPPVAVVFNYYFNEDFKSLKDSRREKESEAAKKGVETENPSFEQLRAEENEIAPYLIFTIRDADSKVVRLLKAPFNKGVAKLEWDMRYAGFYPVAKNSGTNSFANDGGGAPVLPGKYSVEISKWENGVITKVVDPQTFEIKGLVEGKPFESSYANHDFYLESVRLNGNFTALEKYFDEVKTKVELAEAALKLSPIASKADYDLIESMKNQLKSIEIEIKGDDIKMNRNADFAPSLNDRLGKVVWGIWGSSEGPTETHKRDYQIVLAKSKSIYQRLLTIENVDLVKINKVLDESKVPFTPGRKIDF